MWIKRFGRAPPNLQARLAFPLLFFQRALRWALVQHIIHPSLASPWAGWLDDWLAGHEGQAVAAGGCGGALFCGGSAGASSSWGG